MPELSLFSVRSGARYAGRQTSPAALAAAIALNGGVIALLIALPASQILIPNDPPTKVRWIELDPPPPPNPEPVETTRTNPTQPRTGPIDTPQDFIVPRPDIALDGLGTLTGGEESGPIGLIAEPAEPPIRPSEPVFKAARQDPRHAAAFRPDYPAALVRADLEGSVTVRVTIDETGRVIACALVKTSHKAFFEETRQQALRYWRFLPATRDGEPVQSVQELTVTFDLEG
jgi:periplasmic protein TonB